MSVQSAVSIIKPISSSSPNVINKTSGLVDTEFTQLLTDGTKKLLVKVRGLATLRIAFSVGETATKYVTIRPGTVYAEEGLDLSAFTLYMRLDKATQVVEILEWQ